jgi:hypothetical protein
MIWGAMFERMYSKHTQSIKANQTIMRKSFQKNIELIPEVEKRIQLLSQTEYLINAESEETAIKTVGKTMGEWFNNQGHAEMSQYDAYNLMTWYISHQIDIAQRQNYQRKVSKLFHL